jgi:hypothetical protein
MPNDADRMKFADEYRKQRHEFILKYYDMAQKDLERHLKMGWETIATAAGAVALLSAGQQGYLPLPLAVSISLMVCFWGLWNIIDAGYWSTRAIAFLANVEALYFYKDDLTYFNPYAGMHPPIKLMNSLKAQFVAVVGVITIAFVFFTFHVDKRADGISNINQALVSLSSFRVFIWFLPLYALATGTLYAVHLWYKRVIDYRDFVKDSPGPGMLNNRKEYRIIDPAYDNSGNPIDNLSDITSGTDIQSQLLDSLEKSVKNWTQIRKWTFIVISTVVILSLIWIVLKPTLYGSCFSCFR